MYSIRSPTCFDGSNRHSTNFKHTDYQYLPLPSPSHSQASKKATHSPAPSTTSSGTALSPVPSRSMDGLSWCLSSKDGFYSLRRVVSPGARRRDRLPQKMQSHNVSLILAYKPIFTGASQQAAQNLLVGRSCARTFCLSPPPMGNHIMELML